MSTCYYYLKALFPKKEIKSSFNKIKAIIKESFLLEECELNINNIKKRAPNLYDYMKRTGDIKNNPLKLENSLIFNIYDIDNLSYSNDVLYYCAEISHLDSWDQFCKYLIENLKAIKAVWVNEESINPIKYLQFYNYKEIVDRLVQNKKILPMLRNIHKDLDEIIDKKFFKKE